MGNRDLSLLTDNFRPKVESWIADVNKNSLHEIFVTDGFRTQEEQAELYEQGRTTEGPIVTRTLESNHMEGEAVDVAFKGEETYPSSHSTREYIATIANKYGIDWGYDLWEKDKPHFQDNGKDFNNYISAKLKIFSGAWFVFNKIILRLFKNWKKSKRDDEKYITKKLEDTIREYAKFYDKTL